MQVSISRRFTTAMRHALNRLKLFLGLMREASKLEAVIIALIEYVGAPLVLRLIAAKTSEESAVAELRAAYAAQRLIADAAAKAIIEAP